MGERAEGGLERCQCLLVRRAPRLPNHGLAEVANGLVPDLTANRMVGEPLDVLRQTVRIDALDGLGDSGVQGAAALVEQPAVGDLVRQRMLEGVLDLREKPRLVHELCRPKLTEAAAQRLLTLT